MYSTSLLSRKFKSLPTPTSLHTVHCKDEDSDIFSKIFEYLKKNISQKSYGKKYIIFTDILRKKCSAHCTNIFEILLMNFSLVE